DGIFISQDKYVAEILKKFDFVSVKTASTPIETQKSYIDELMYSFFANQSSGPHLDHEDLEQLDEFDLEDIDLKWQVAMIFMRLKKFYKKTGRRLQFDAKEPVGFDKTKVECFNCHNTGHFSRECRSKGNQESRRRDAWNTRYKAKDNRRRPGKQEEPKALVTLDGEGVDWTGHAEDEQENFALMAYSNSGSDTEVSASPFLCNPEIKQLAIKLGDEYGFVIHGTSKQWYFDKGLNPAGSTGLRAATATGSGETTHGGGLKYSSNKWFETGSHSLSWMVEHKLLEKLSFARVLN
ncbi:ribonuclease H-like domain-containing protein, partial [Tanacetum coccineum]